MSDRIFRAANTEENVETCKEICERYPRLIKGGFMEGEEFKGLTKSKSLGGLEYGAGAKVVHVPTYLKGLLSYIMSAPGSGEVKLFREGRNFEELGKGGEERSEAKQSDELTAQFVNEAPLAC